MVMITYTVYRTRSNSNRSFTHVECTWSGHLTGSSQSYTGTVKWNSYC